MKISLYAYFGLLELHTIDSPGHSLYQLGLIDSLRENFNEDKFDFYSYYPPNVIASNKISKSYPEGNICDVFKKYQELLINDQLVSMNKVLSNIREKAYTKLYLKARFRNLSTLTKKWRDARDFEIIIEEAISSGYSKSEIIILDTDLSLPERFIKNYSDLVTIKIPSIDFPGISTSFLNDCVEENIKSFSVRKNKDIVYYGNINTANYKSGNSKSDVLGEVLEYVDSFYSKEESNFQVICKPSDFTFVASSFNTDRKDREKIWSVLDKSAIMLNISKEKYDTHKFIPARIFEAMIFGMIPVSYKFSFMSETFSFNDTDELFEILTYLNECDLEDLKAAYLHFIKSYRASLSK